LAGWAGWIRLLLAAEVWLAWPYCCCCCWGGGTCEGFLAGSLGPGNKLLDVFELGLRAAGPFGADFSEMFEGLNKKGKLLFGRI
jgi:hypothetical protein